MLGIPANVGVRFQNASPMLVSTFKGESIGITRTKLEDRFFGFARLVPIRVGKREFASFFFYR